MKTISILPLAILAMLASSAYGQNLCPQQYEACIDGCLAGSKSAQLRCIPACQSKNNDCYAKRHGRPTQSIAGAPRPAEANAQSKDADKKP